MADVTVIILTKNEEKNIEASVKSAKQIADRVIVVDSGSTDRTLEIATANGAETCFHEWSTHARQFNWALDNCNIKTEWVFRLDADERITAELGEEINSLASDEYVAYELRWQMYFMGKRLKHGGTHNTYVTRLFKFGKARAEDKAMDERLIVEGSTGRLKNDFIHFDYKGIDEWIIKHLKYSNLEIDSYFGKSVNSESRQAKKRGFYYKLPKYLRARLYYWHRYYGLLGFLDGKEGKVFIYLQAYWYRFLIDAKIQEMENKNK